MTSRGLYSWGGGPGGLTAGRGCSLSRRSGFLRVVPSARGHGRASRSGQGGQELLEDLLGNKHAKPGREGSFCFPACEFPLRFDLLDHRGSWRGLFHPSPISVDNGVSVAFALAPDGQTMEEAGQCIAGSKISDSLCG